MPKKHRRNKQRTPASDTASQKRSTIRDPFLTTGSGDNRKSASTIFNTAKTGSRTDPQLISDLQKIANSPIPTVPFAEAEESPSYRASERAKIRQRQSSPNMRSSPPLFRSSMIDYDDLDHIMDFGNHSEDDKTKRESTERRDGLNQSARSKVKHESESDSDSASGSSSDASSASGGEDSDTLALPTMNHHLNEAFDRPSIFAPSSPHSQPILKRRLSHISSSASSSSGSESENGNDDSTDHREAKRIKSHPSAKSKSSTVATRNPLPPELLNGTIKPRPSSAQLDFRDISPDEPKPKIDRYPTDVLAAALSLEAILPPYLLSATNSDTGQSLDSEPLRPAAGSDDTTKLFTVLKSARKLIIHLSVKKLSESETDMQTQMVRIAKDREQLLKVMEGEVKRLLAKDGKR